MRVGIVTVGDELLAGETADTNAAWLCARLADRGATVERVTTVPDRVADVAEVVADFHDRYDAVLVTGGLGPTHDDRTVEGVAAALDRPVVEHPEAVAGLADRGYAREDLAAGTADLPEGARVLHNDVGVAPGAVVESVYVLPGVPAEMEAMFEAVAAEFEGPTRHRRSLDVDEPESALLARFEELRGEFDVSVGSYPGESVTVRVESTDPEAVEGAVAWLRDRVEVAGPDADDRHGADDAGRRGGDGGGTDAVTD